ncbi:teichoic acid ABC transporter permease [Bacillus wiedmannii]|uniref:ABC transporter permease n=1 Tax=Bacillus wiedmannii TaxID=1890302 RepID=UPI000BF1AA37|nr:ABC transporter permease [Bacillus wiedmannii]PEK04076.1 teichoic acid ABC transporter permease [Bacillus wiedmannii]PEL42443.1 teichoic acid ABC transporter permease [Bacillus wiedmannii]PEL80704.1 teichoic acid ABC transporter permease [Bacillus wiedmannii]PEM33280.1 teichoic acid ABC transporter permease [Bacillus wiedmannii]PEM90856.1 teichoic acid ABC transporter permease [Bacillus wiedmannii]
MKSMIMVLKEQVNSLYLIKRLSIYQVKSTNNNNYLGLIWEILNPLIQMSIYWFVFGLGIRGGQGVDGVPFIYWLSAGLVVWFFVNPAMLQASKSIYTRLNMVSKMNFPMSVIPSFVIMSNLYQHLILIGIVTILFLVTGQGISIHYIQLVYYIFATIILIFSLSLITSTLATIVRDVQMIVQSIMRMLLYLTPILWTPERLSPIFQKIMQLNPFCYIVNGYRGSLLGTSWFYEEWGYALYFWLFVLVTLLIGTILHVKFRKHFADYL